LEGETSDPDQYRPGTDGTDPDPRMRTTEYRLGSYLFLQR
jgi:hypothetical protein